MNKEKNPSTESDKGGVWLIILMFYSILFWLSLVSLELLLLLGKQMSACGLKAYSINE